MKTYQTENPNRTVVRQRKTSKEKFDKKSHLKGKNEIKYDFWS